MALIMWWSNSPKLGKLANRTLQSSPDPMYLSAVSVWEIANKIRIGKLPEIEDFEGQLPTMMRANAFVMLDLTATHALRAGFLNGLHRDPFDRLIAGQALAERLTVITSDRQIGAFGCETIW